MGAVHEVLPKVEHRMCAQHILSAWRKKWKGDERKNKFWECAYSTFEGQFKDKLQEMDKLGDGIVEDLLCYPHHTWCRAYIGIVSKCDAVENNMSETFNGWILDARFKSIITMLEEIRKKVMERIAVMRVCKYMEFRNCTNCSKQVR